MYGQLGLVLSRVPLGAAPSYRARVRRLDINHL